MNSTAQDGDGSLLDHSIILFGSGLGNGDLHEPKRLPLILAGGAAMDRSKGGHHLKYPDGTALPNLHVSLLNKLGVPVESVGSSTGRLPLEPLSDL